MQIIEIEKNLISSNSLKKYGAMVDEGKSYDVDHALLVHFIVTTKDKKIKFVSDYGVISVFSEFIKFSVDFIILGKKNTKISLSYDFLIKFERIINKKVRVSWGEICKSYAGDSFEINEDEFIKNITNIVFFLKQEVSQIKKFSEITSVHNPFSILFIA